MRLIKKHDFGVTSDMVKAIMKKGGKNPEKGDIMFGASCGDRFLQSITGRRSFPHIHVSNP